jgi:hypothetical protein
VAKVFFSYTHVDEDLRNKLETHLTMLKRQGLIETWHDRRIVVGQEIDGEIDANLDGSDIILLLVSAAFLDSSYCFDLEMKQAMAKHEEGTARVIPIILKPCDWQPAPFGKLLAAPKDGKAITTWNNIDEAFVDVVKSIRAAVAAAPPKRPRNDLTEMLSRANGRASGPPPVAFTGADQTSPVSGLPEDFDGLMRAAMGTTAAPRSSNLRIAKVFTDHDRDTFSRTAFNLMTRFFRNSLAELEVRNPDIKGEFQEIDAHHFAAAIYRDGRAIARCKIWFGNPFGVGSSNNIFYSASNRAADNSYNEALTIADDKQILFLRAIMQSLSRNGIGSDKLSDEGAAEYYWAMFIEPLQR